MTFDAVVDELPRLTEHPGAVVKAVVEFGFGG